MYTMMANVQMTRRKQLCFVLDEHDEVRWTGQSVGGALQYLIEQGETEFNLEGPNTDDHFVVTVRRT